MYTVLVDLLCWHACSPLILIRIEGTSIVSVVIVYYSQDCCEERRRVGALVGLLSIRCVAGSDAFAPSLWYKMYIFHRTV